MCRAFIIVAMLNMVPLREMAAAPCLAYGGISLTGTLVRQTYAGPPDYESVTKGDEPRVIWVLQLDRYICVDATARFPREPIAQEIEVALTTEQSAQYRELLGQRIVATGELRHGGANYQKRLVLMVTDIKQIGLLQ